VDVITYQKVKAVHVRPTVGLTFLCSRPNLPVLLAQFDGSLID